MKIAFLNIYNGSVERGSEVFVDEIATRFADSYQVDVFQIGKKASKKYTINQIKGIPYIKNQTLIYDFFLFLFSLKCFLHLLKNKYDWIIPINGSAEAVICRIAGWLTRSKILISGHAGVGRDDRINIFLGRPDVFVALSQKALEWVKKKFPFQKVIYIPNGVDLSQFNISVKPIDVGLNSPIILCVSALLPYKRINLLVDAVSLIPNASLLLIGDGPFYENIYNQAFLKLQGRFKIIKKVDHGDIANYYGIAKVFSLPSKDSEAFGLVYLEALASNIPVVAPVDQSRRSIVADAGLYADVEDPVIYSQALIKAIRYNWGDKPRKQAEKFSWDNISLQYKKIIENKA